MSSQSQPPRFLLDENIHGRLKSFLVSRKFKVINVSKGAANGEVATLSRSRELVLVTNDVDFNNPRQYQSNNIFSVILLRLPQGDAELLVNRFSQLLKEKTSKYEFKGKAITIKKDSFEETKLL